MPPPTRTLPLLNSPSLFRRQIDPDLHDFLFNPPKPKPTESAASANGRKIAFVLTPIFVLTICLSLTYLYVRHKGKEIKRKQAEEGQQAMQQEGTAPTPALMGGGLDGGTAQAPPVRPVHQWQQPQNMAVDRYDGSQTNGPVGAPEPGSRWFSLANHRNTWEPNAGTVGTAPYPTEPPPTYTVLR